MTGTTEEREHALAWLPTDGSWRVLTRADHDAGITFNLFRRISIAEYEADFDSTHQTILRRRTETKP